MDREEKVMKRLQEHYNYLIEQRARSSIFGSSRFL